MIINNTDFTLAEAIGIAFHLTYGKDPSIRYVDWLADHAEDPETELIAMAAGLISDLMDGEHGDLLAASDDDLRKLTMANQFFGELQRLEDFAECLARDRRRSSSDDWASSFDML